MLGGRPLLLSLGQRAFGHDSCASYQQVVSPYTVCVTLFVLMYKWRSRYGVQTTVFPYYEVKLIFSFGLKIRIRPYAAAEWLTLLLHVWDVQGSNLDSDTGLSWQDFREFPHTLQANAGTPWIRPWVFCVIFSVINVVAIHMDQQYSQRMWGTKNASKNTFFYWCMLLLSSINTGLK
jgi:hypothetical protein